MFTVFVVDFFVWWREWSTGCYSVFDYTNAWATATEFWL